MCDVLLAYVGEDAPHAEAIAEALDALGFSVGDAHASDAELRASGARIVIWSPAAARSRALVAAAERFIASGDTLVASLSDPGASNSQDLPVFDLSGWSGEPDDAGLDPLLDVVRRMVIVAGGAPGAGDDDDALDADFATYDPDVPQAAQERASAAWLATVPAAPLHARKTPWPGTVAHRFADAAQAAPKRSILASLVVGAFLAGALLTGNLDRLGAPQGARSYAEIPPAVTAPVAFDDIAVEPGLESRAPASEPAAAPVDAVADAAPDAAALGDAVPVVTRADYVPPPFRSWEPHKLFVTAEAPAPTVNPREGGLIPVKLMVADPEQSPPGPLPETLSETSSLDLGQGD